MGRPGQMPDYIRKLYGNMGEDENNRSREPEHEVRWVCPRCGTTNRIMSTYSNERNLRCGHCNNLKP